MLYRARLAFKHKLGLVLVFSLVTIVICLAIARAIEVSRGGNQDGVILALWSITESTACK